MLPEQNASKGAIFDETAYRERPRIEVSDDKMSAYIIISEDPLYTDIFSLVSEAGIYVGIDTVMMKEVNNLLLLGRKTERRYLIASGKQPVNGQNGELILRTTKPTDLILSSEDISSVDYRVYKQKQLALAEKEMPVAMIISPTKGRDGLNVFGESIPAQDGAEVELDLGKNVYLSGKKLVSTIDGLVEYSKSGNVIKFDISDIYLVKGDVDFTTGNINFPGSVIVKGSIKAGFEVIAKNEVIATTIRGKVVAGGGVTARQGIIGGQAQAEIQADGSVYAKFVHKAKITSGDSVVIKKSIMNSEIYADNSVMVESTPGSIIGGKTYAVNEISAKIFGSESYVKTEVAIFPSVKDVLEMRKTVAERYETSKTLIKLENYLGSNKDILMKQGPQRQAMVDKLIRKREQMRKEIVVMDMALKEIQIKLAQKSTGKIYVGKTAHPEVKFMIGGRFYLTNDETTKGFLKYDEAAGDILFSN